MDDLISRAAIEWHNFLVDDGNGMYHDEKVAYKSQIDMFPSVQPKAIRPKFVAEDRFIKNHFSIYPHCPKCNYELETGDCYCKVCGCHIDWSEDDVPGNGL